MLEVDQLERTGSHGAVYYRARRRGASGRPRWNALLMAQGGSGQKTLWESSDWRLERIRNDPGAPLTIEVRNRDTWKKLRMRLDGSWTEIGGQPGDKQSTASA